MKSIPNQTPIEPMKTTESILVCFDYTNGLDNSVLVVGKKRKGQSVEIINAFSGKEAEELWNKLTVKKEKENGN